MLTFEPISRIAVVKCLGPRLVLFFKTFALFYVLYPKYESTVGYCVFKCAPILSLVTFVYMYGVKIPNNQAYSLKIFLGLLFSCLGDAFLVWPSLLIPGMAMFAITHILYIYAFGFQRLKLSILFILLPILLCVCVSVKEGLDGINTLVIPAYGLILVIMVWRALAQLTKHEYSIPWTCIASAVGGLLFGVSDTILGICLFSSDISSFKCNLILPTYYAGQLLISVSVVDSHLTSIKTSPYHEDKKQ
ncbi:Lysoplasmalogenase-like protein tmem86a [Schistosoma haematobium]|uniref:lysoplasmalogenase n=1 Tax=Schistosoma haematobium TaxID=6185 RepID=A0A922IQJ6_SCHHA|nr:Lysoplasmalogenase-like protein tmem86a [Schistosoma haematobium]KAH9583780.1 Lysoplasmalogenase-like protein tmem86a [Schistosoma haematobium]